MEILSMTSMKKYIWPVILLIIMLCNVPVLADSDIESTKTVEQISEELQNNLNIVWTCIAAFLVFFMQAGFAMLEAGFSRAKNVINILMKNLMDFSIGTLVFFFVGFGFMFGVTNGLFGTKEKIK